MKGVGGMFAAEGLSEIKLFGRLSFCVPACGDRELLLHLLSRVCTTLRFSKSCEVCAHMFPRSPCVDLYEPKEMCISVLLEATLLE